MKRVHTISLNVILLCSLLVCSVDARADGGKLRFSKPAGPFEVTLFTTPEPLTPGAADFSVMVQDGVSNQVLPDAAIDMTLTGPAGQNLQAHASAGVATNRLLQAAKITLPSIGVWHVSVHVAQAGRTGVCDADVAVGAGSRRSYLIWIFSLLPVFATMLFVLNQKQKSQASSRSASKH